MSFPKRIRINGRRWTIKQTELEAGTLGECRYLQHTICISPAVDHPLEQRDTVLHEICHGLIHVNGVESPDQDAEEKYVRAIASGLIGVFMDNPKLVEWLVNPPSTEP